MRITDKMRLDLLIKLEASVQGWKGKYWVEAGVHPIAGTREFSSPRAAIDFVFRAQEKKK
jgi:hypothetical protein